MSVIRYLRQDICVIAQLYRQYEIILAHFKPPSVKQGKNLDKELNYTCSEAMQYWAMKKHYKGWIIKWPSFTLFSEYSCSHISW